MSGAGRWPLAKIRARVDARDCDTYYGVARTGRSLDAIRAGMLIHRERIDWAHGISRRFLDGR